MCTKIGISANFTEIESLPRNSHSFDTLLASLLEKLVLFQQFLVQSLEMHSMPTIQECYLSDKDNRVNQAAFIKHFFITIHTYKDKT